MKKTLVLICVVALAVLVGSSAAFLPLMGGRGEQGTPAAPTYLLEDDFEGTGIPSASWVVNGGTVDWDNSTSPAPLSGSESARSVDGSNKATRDFPTDHAIVWCAFMLEVTALPPSDAYPLSMNDYTATSIFYTILGSDGSWTIKANTASESSSVGTLAADTTSWVMVKGDKSGSGQLWLTTSTSSWGTPVESSGGTARQDAGSIIPIDQSATYDMDWIIDDLVCDTSIIPISYFQ